VSPADPTPPLERGRWQLDAEHSQVEFVTRTLWGVIPVRGTFSEYQGSFELSRTPAIELVISAASLDTANPKRDDHLRSRAFFDVETNPEVRFASTELELHGDHLHVTGTLSAAGQSVTIEPQTHIRTVDGGYVIDAVARVSHGDLGLTTNPAGMIKSKTWLSVQGRLIPA
jgi:polyisoprenoid-binding protein YceI